MGLSEKGTSCTLKFKTSTNITIVNIGDYISYTQSKTSYTIPSSDTGYKSDQTINLSELKLWRVIRKNSNGTVDVVSEYVPNMLVWISGKIGYEKYIGTLNTIAKQYETTGITVGSRAMGYNGQTATVTTSTSTTAPWTTTTPSPTSSSASITPAITNGSAREKAGGGDYGYLTDYELVKKAIGTVKAFDVVNKKSCGYRLASRKFEYGGGTYWYYMTRGTGCSEDVSSSWVYKYDSGWWYETLGGSLRPILTLSSSLNVLKKSEDGKDVWKIN